jgi:hypothetical protein
MDMNAIFAEYETRRDAGDKETAELIGDVYTVLDMLDSGADAEENRDFFEKTYYGMSAVAWKIEKFHPGRLFEIRMACENALVGAGILEADEEPEEAEEYDSETNWDEWAADQRYDMYRDMDIAMGYER